MTHNLKAIKEHDKKVKLEVKLMMKLIGEIKDRMERIYLLGGIGLEEIRQISALLERGILRDKRRSRNRE